MEDVQDYLFYKPNTHGVSALVCKCLFNSLRAVRDQRSPSDVYRQILVVSFLPFERKLLADLTADALPEKLRDDAKSPGPIDLVWYRLFYRWSWASAVLRQILAELDPNALEMEHEGDQKRAWEMCLKILRTKNTRIISDRRYYRTEQFIRDNRAFLLHIGRLDRTEIAVQPPEEDLYLWRMLGYLFVENSHVMKYWPGFQSLSQGFSRSSFATKVAGECLHVTYEDLDGQPVEHFKEVVFKERVGNNTRQESYYLPHFAISQSWTFLDEKDVASEASTSENTAAGGTSGSEVAINVIIDANDVWDVWSFVRLFRLHLRSVSPVTTAFSWEEFTASTAFSEHWEAKMFRRFDESRNEVGYFPKKSEMKSEVSSTRRASQGVTPLSPRKDRSNVPQNPTYRKVLPTFLLHPGNMSSFD